jgi:hypothetical protein
MEMSALPFRRGVEGAASVTRPLAWRPHPHPCPSSIEGEGSVWRTGTHKLRKTWLFGERPSWVRLRCLGELAMKKVIIAVALLGMTFGLAACETMHKIFG